MPTEYIAGQAHKLVEIDKAMHWHLVGIRRDGNSFTMHITRSWSDAENGKAIMNKADSEKQWNSPVAVERFNYAVHQCWAQRCLDIWSLKTTWPPPPHSP